MAEGAGKVKRPLSPSVNRLDTERDDKEAERMADAVDLGVPCACDPNGGMCGAHYALYAAFQTKEENVLVN